MEANIPIVPTESGKNNKDGKASELANTIAA